MLLNTQPIKAFSNLYNQELSFDSILKQDEEGRPYHAILHNSLKEYMLSLAKNLANDQKSPPVIIDYNIYALNDNSKFHHHIINYTFICCLHP